MENIVTKDIGLEIVQAQVDGTPKALATADLDPTLVKLLKDATSLVRTNERLTRADRYEFELFLTRVDPRDFTQVSTTTLSWEEAKMQGIPQAMYRSVSVWGLEEEKFFIRGTLIPETGLEDLPKVTQVRLFGEWILTPDQLVFYEKEKNINPNPDEVGVSRYKIKAIVARQEYKLPEAESAGSQLISSQDQVSADFEAWKQKILG